MAAIKGYEINCRDCGEFIYSDEAEETCSYCESRNVRVFPCVKCTCGKDVVVCRDSWSNPCSKCSREYNRDGSELAPRSQWGEETGERFA